MCVFVCYDCVARAWSSAHAWFEWELRYKCFTVFDTLNQEQPRTQNRLCSGKFSAGFQGCIQLRSTRVCVSKRRIVCGLWKGSHRGMQASRACEATGFQVGAVAKQKWNLENPDMVFRENA